MHDENGIRCFALCILVLFSQRPVMEAHLWRRFARGKLEVANRVVAFRRRRVIGGRREMGGENGQEKCKDSDCWIHVTTHLLSGVMLSLSETSLILFAWRALQK